jgi:hypothetical protein
VNDPQQSLAGIATFGTMTMQHVDAFRFGRFLRRVKLRPQLGKQRDPTMLLAGKSALHIPIFLEQGVNPDAVARVARDQGAAERADSDSQRSAGAIAAGAIRQRGPRIRRTARGF